MLKTSEERLALNAYEQILQMVLSGEAAHGQMINERRLADMLGISRTPVRDALVMLEAEGLLHLPTERHVSGLIAGDLVWPMLVNILEDNHELARFNTLNSTRHANF